MPTRPNLVLLLFTGLACCAQPSTSHAYDGIWLDPPKGIADAWSYESHSYLSPAQRPAATWHAGGDLLFLRPQFSSNPAFSVAQVDGGTYANIVDRELEFDCGASPRVWLGCDSPAGVGVRAAFWYFDQAAGREDATISDGGFSSLALPPVGPTQLATGERGTTANVGAGLRMYALDLEITKTASPGDWDLLVSGGLRYASIDQTYRARIRDANDVLRGSIDYAHGLQGIGPTLSIQAHRCLAWGAGLFGLARGSVLFGTGDVSLAAYDNLASVSAFTMDYSAERDDVLPVGEVQIGADWKGRRGAWGQFFIRGAFEGQVWWGAGNASSEDAEVGLLGVSIGAGWLR
jgi:hypothetical protein